MKNIVGWGLILFALNSCETPCTENYLAIVNNSGKNIEITSYEYHFVHEDRLSKTITIVNNDKYGQTFKSCGNQGTDKFHFGTLVEGDSIVIDYGDRIKGYTQYTNSESRNPYVLDRNNQANDFIYTLTPEDYANATPKQ